MCVVWRIIYTQNVFYLQIPTSRWDPGNLFVNFVCLSYFNFLIKLTLYVLEYEKVTGCVGRKCNELELDLEVHSGTCNLLKQKSTLINLDVFILGKPQQIIPQRGILPLKISSNSVNTVLFI
jgi:hypothetical protein